MTATIEIPREILNELVVKVLGVEKKYAHELTGVKNDRRTEIKQLVNKIAGDKLEK
jgi:hypothetical protein